MADKELVTRLHTAAHDITKLILSQEHMHMKEPWEMVLGGLIIPEMVKHQPDVLDKFPEFIDLLKQHSPEKVREFFTPKTVENEVVVEKEVIKEVVKKEIVTVNSNGKPLPKHTPNADGGKHRRLKAGVNKTKKFEREISCSDRDHVLKWWNQNQHLVPKDDPICVRLAEEINLNNTGIDKPIAPAQLSDYVSWLCRLAKGPQKDRDGYTSNAIGGGFITIAPVFSAELMQEVVDNYNQQQEEKRIRDKAHQDMRAEIAKTGGVVPAPEPTAIGFEQPGASKPAPAPKQAAAPAPAPQPAVVEEPVQEEAPAPVEETQAKVETQQEEAPAPAPAVQDDDEDIDITWA